MRICCLLTLALMSVYSKPYFDFLCLPNLPLFSDHCLPVSSPTARPSTLRLPASRLCRAELLDFLVPDPPPGLPTTRLVTLLCFCFLACLPVYDPALTRQRILDSAILKPLRALNPPPVSESCIPGPTPLGTRHRIKTIPTHYRLSKQCPE